MEGYRNNRNVIITLLVLTASHYVTSLTLKTLDDEISDEEIPSINYDDVIPAADFYGDNWMMSEYHSPVYDQKIRREKRYFCRRYFVYNPVTGRCQPTLMALRKGRSGAKLSW